MKPNKPSRIVISTRNAGKLAEIHALVALESVQFLALDAFPGAPEVEEDRDTLRGNAAKKAELIMEFTGLPALADDTGLEVDALDGAPGVWSARYAGEHCTPADNRRKLLHSLRDTEHRSARFRTVLALATPEGTHFFDGTCEGHITRNERGSGGFGYDAIFQPADHSTTFAQMDAETKNAISHRGRALAAFVAWMTA